MDRELKLLYINQLTRNGIILGQCEVISLKGIKTIKITQETGIRKWNIYLQSNRPTALICSLYDSDF